MATATSAGRFAGVRRYSRVRLKFIFAVSFALLWTLFSIIVAEQWLRDLGEATHPIFALIALTFIAFVPGFMNAFLLFTLLLDKRPPREAVAIYPGVSVLIAAYQEEAAIGQTLESLASTHYPGPLEIIVINDGSTDQTSAIVNAQAQALPFDDKISIRFLDFQENRGKAAALNSGLKAARHDLIVTVDADSRLLADSVTMIVERLLSDGGNTQAVAGAVLVGNPRESLLAGAQQWDYFHGIAAVKRMQSMYHGTLVAQGAFSVYRRRALETIGGWPECVGEDIVLTWALLRAGYRTGYAEDAVVFTNAPTTFSQFAQQRRRWSRGLVEALVHHEELLLKPRMTTMFIWWNLLFMPMDLVFTFVFIPGLILAMFGIFWIAGPITLLTLPLAGLWNLVIFRIQRATFKREGLELDRNYPGLFFYLLIYAIVMQPVCLWGYATELAGLRKKWGTK